jgi:hypothetical protein
MAMTVHIVRDGENRASFFSSLGDATVYALQVDGDIVVRRDLRARDQMTFDALRFGLWDGGTLPSKNSQTPRKEEHMRTHHHGSGRWGTRPRRALGYDDNRFDDNRNSQGSGRWGKEPSDPSGGYMPMSVMPANETDSSGTGGIGAARQTSPNRQNNRGAAIVNFLSSLDISEDKIEQVLQLLNGGAMDAEGHSEQDPEESTPDQWDEDPIDPPKDRKSARGLKNARKPPGKNPVLSGDTAREVRKALSYAKRHICPWMSYDEAYNSGSVSRAMAVLSGRTSKANFERRYPETARIAVLTGNEMYARRDLITPPAATSGRRGDPLAHDRAGRKPAPTPRDVFLADMSRIGRLPEYAFGSRPAYA